MATKNIYLYKVTIKDESTGIEVSLDQYKSLFQSIIAANSRNNALRLSTVDEPEVTILDIIDNTDECLFARLNRKKLNNSMQKRNYRTYEISDVLQPDEIAQNGVESFTYCILGYSHGILSMVNSKGAPAVSVLSHIFALYRNQYSLETEPTPNQDLLGKLVDGKSNPAVLEQLFGFSEAEIINTVSRNASSLVFEIKPDFRGALANDKNKVRQIIDILRENGQNYNSVVLSGKSNTGERQQKYDLFEEYFKYPISINEVIHENGRIRERGRAQLQMDYRNKMQNVYNEYKRLILLVSGR